jgi:hypothetical protein
MKQAKLFIAAVRDTAPRKQKLIPFVVESLSTQIQNQNSRVSSNISACIEFQGGA